MTAIDRDLSCLNCGYNLRTLNTHGACPECGMAVGVTLREDRLADAPPSYLHALQRGAAALWWGALLALPVFPLGLALAWLGLWLLTRKQSNRKEPTKDRRIRLIARCFSTFGTFGLVTLLVVIPLMIVDQDIRPFDGWHEIDGTFILITAILFAGLFASWEHISILAKRIPDAVLEKSCRRVRWRWSYGLAGLIVIALIADVANAISVMRPFRTIWATLILIGAVGIILLWLWFETLRFAGRLRRGLGRLAPKGSTT